MELHFLEARVPLVKKYIQTDEGIEKTSYPMVQQITSHLENVSNPREFFSALRYHSRNGHCLLKGQLDKKLYFESRAGHTSAMDRTQWFCLDFDYLNSEDEIDSILAKMGLDKTTYILQYGAGHKIDKKFSAHLFFLLKQPVLPEQLKYWLMHHNLTQPVFERAIQLSRSNAAIRWPLDVMVNQNHMLLYIAPPECEGFEDPIDDGRLRLVEKDRESIDILNWLNDIDSSVVEEQKQTKLNELRKAKGLKARKFATKLVSGIEVLSKPGVVAVTDQHEARGFMYLNLNGGDSWGYYHPVDNPEILYNFKGEPNYLVKELLPEYYKNYKAVLRQIQQEEQGDLKYLAFLDRSSDQYFRGTYDSENRKLEIFPTNSLKKLEDFLKQHGQWVGDYVEEWDYVFRFDDKRICVPEEKFLNRYQETDYLAEGRMAPSPKRFPPIIRKVLMSVTGGNPTAVKRFLNWLAFIVQKRRMTQTAWVFNGVQGTGKGLLMHHILAPIIGEKSVQVKLMSELEDTFNAYMEECVLLLIDEAEHRQLNEESRTMARLKNAITDSEIPIRRMHAGHYTAKNYMNVLVASNHRTAVAVEDSDRRFNVADYQEERLIMTDAEVDKIKEELFDFVSLLYKINIDTSILRTPMQTDSRELMKDLTSTAIKNTIRFIQRGDLQSLIDIIPSTRSPGGRDGVDRIALDQVRQFLIEAERTSKRSKEHIIDRDDLHQLLVLTNPESVPRSTSKFVQQMKHYGIHFHREEGILGIPIMWGVPEYGIEDEEQQLKAVK